MKILDMPCTKGFMQLAQDGVDKGWHEMNGGNLSYRLTKDEAANVKKVMKKASGAWTDICESVPKLAGEFFMVTRTTGYMRNVMRNPENAFGIVEIDATGTKYRIWWGLADGGRPTSEFPSHLKNHEVKLETTGGEHRVIYHAADGQGVHARAVGDHDGMPRDLPRGRGRGAVDGAGEGPDRHGHVEAHARLQHRRVGTPRAVRLWKEL